MMNGPLGGICMLRDGRALGYKLVWTGVGISWNSKVVAEASGGGADGIRTLSTITTLETPAGRHFSEVMRKHAAGSGADSDDLMLLPYSLSRPRWKRCAGPGRLPPLRRESRWDYGHAPGRRLSGAGLDVDGRRAGHHRRRSPQPDGAPRDENSEGGGRAAGGHARRRLAHRGREPQSLPPRPVHGRPSEPRRRRDRHHRTDPGHPGRHRRTAPPASPSRSAARGDRAPCTSAPWAPATSSARCPC